MKNRVKLLAPYVLASVSALILQSYIFYPGYMSFDSAYQYSQVISGEWNNISPIVMVGLWTLTDAVIPGPGGLFLLFQILSLAGLTLFVFSLSINQWFKFILLFLIFFWPFNLMIMPHLWKDVGLMSLLFLAIGSLNTYRHNGRTISFVLALTALIIASMFRFESIFYLTPLIFYLLSLWFSHHNKSTNKAKLTFLTSLVILTSLASTQVITKLSDSKKIALWQTVALWDMARVSIKVQQLLLPGFTTGEGMTLEDLSRANTSWTNTHLFSKTQSGVNSGLGYPYSNEQNKTLLNSWLNMILSYPVAYLSHRAEVSNELLRINDAEKKPVDIYYTRKQIYFSDGHTLNDSSINLTITKWVNKHLNDFYFMGWFYCLIQFVLLVVMFFRKQSANRMLIMALSSSGLLSVLALTFVAPSAEQRYLIWLVNSTLLASSLVLRQKQEFHKDCNQNHAMI
ncbi:MAG: hypothetical protein R3E90_05640 [Marinicella sp.]|nr:hypothetical protein [Xanthomonadales bacterium]